MNFIIYLNCNFSKPIDKIAWLFYFCVFISAACHNAKPNQNQRFNIKLSADSQSVYVYGIDYATLQELKRDSLSTENWQAIFPVYKIPADTDMKDMQKEQPGIYEFTDSTITFKPDTAFKEHQQYFVRFYGSDTFLTSSRLIRSKAKLKGPGYVEMVFTASSKSLPGGETFKK